MKTGRTPLRQPSLRNPAESLMKLREVLIDDKFMPVASISVMMVLFSVYLWLIHFGIFPLNAIGFSLVALCTVVFTAWKFFQVRSQTRLINRGIEAEKAMGQFLEQFRAKGYAVFHDIPAESGEKKFNIDGLLVGPKGIFTIETKGRTKPLKGPCKIVYDGETVSINGQAPDPTPINQAMAEASWIRDYISSCTALTFVPVTPIVIFPGWYIDYQKARRAEVRVTTEKLIWSCIQHSPHHLAPHDAKLIESRLADHIQRQSAS